MADTGTTIRFSFGHIIIGALVTVFPVGASEDLPISGAIPTADGPTLGAVVAAFRNASGFAIANVKLLAPSKPNDGRIVAVDAETVAK